MELDANKFINLIRKRPALYNNQLKDYSKKDVIDRLWDEIAQEMNVPVFECRMKWHNLRCSYARYLREMKKTMNGTGRTKKKWHLADNMSFLNDYLKEPVNIDISIDYAENADEETLKSEQEFSEDANLNKSQLMSTSRSLRRSTVDKRKRGFRAERTFPTNVLEPQTTMYLPSIINSQVPESDSPLVNFFKGVLPDIEKLGSKRQRIFKAELVKLINNLVDEEEQENTRPLSTH